MAKNKSPKAKEEAPKEENEAPKKKLMVGLSIPNSTDAANLLKTAREDHDFDYVTTDLPQVIEPRTDVTALESNWWKSCIVGRMSSPSTQQMEWVQHMGLPAVILPEIPTDDDEMHDYCQAVASLLPMASSTALWIRTKMNEQSLVNFDTICRFCDGANIGMMLVMEGQAGDNYCALASFIHKAIGSQLKAVCYPTSSFLTNKKGYPTLSKWNQGLFTQVLRRLGDRVHWLVEAAATGDDETKYSLYVQYLRHLRKRPEVTHVLDTEEAILEVNYLDHLQSPLQPLGDHLHFDTYETFEKDPVKYRQYQKAIYMALRDLASPDQVITLVVVGAGRGPLVNAALRSIDQLQLRCKVYCVEKNPSAVMYLHSLVQTTWKDKVTVVHADMRELTTESFDGAQADIIVSELLGSFGDNELSPECLEGLYATGVCKDTTISIPCQYSSYLAPISSKSLHSKARAQANFPSVDLLGGNVIGHQRAMETPYVVRTHAASQTHVEQLCWSFQHPKEKEAASVEQLSSSFQHLMGGNATDAAMERKAHLKFQPNAMHGLGCGSGYGAYDASYDECTDDASLPATGITIHGLVGTFDALLYSSKDGEDQARISIRPQTFSQGMFSWFPLYFPFKEPLTVPANCTVKCSIWRRTGTGRVWYEWCAKVTDAEGTIVSVSSIHNPNGRSYHVKL